MSKAIVEPTGDKKCPECGKGFFVQWASMWAYTRREGPKERYFCSWSCMRSYDKKKGEKKVGGHRKITKEQEKEAVMLALDGKDPLSFLKECGINNPQQKWYDMRSQIKAEDPETYEKLQKTATKSAGRKKVETPEARLPVQDLKLQPGGNYRISVETPEAPKIYKPVVYDGMTVREVEGQFGRYRRVDVNGKTFIDFQDTDGLDVISRTVDQWRESQEEKLKAALILGVSL